MTQNQTRSTYLQSVIENILEPELQELLPAIANKSAYPSLSLDQGVLSDPEQAARVVAMTSNDYSGAVRLAGLARSAEKIAEADYKYKFRTNLGTGKNQAEREAAAMDAAEQEYQRWVYISSVVELLESIESASRIASESARKIADGAKQGFFAASRYEGNAGSLAQRDFNTF